MNVHVLQHVPFEGLGSIHTWLTRRNATFNCTRFFEPQAANTLPPIDSIDMVIALGGPMSVNDEAELPWLIAEKQFVRQAIQRGLPVLGICLGAQLIASALGARVYPGPTKEIGWFPITANPTPPPHTFRFPPQLTVFHWHGETFDLPPGAHLLASSAVCQHQAFQLAPRAIGLQFHLELTPSSVRDILHGCACELTVGPFIQTAEAIAGASTETFTATNALMDALLDHLTAGRASHLTKASDAPSAPSPAHSSGSTTSSPSGGDTHTHSRFAGAASPTRDGTP